MNLTIFKRLTIGYAVIMILVVFLGAYVTVKLNQINHLTRDIVSVDLGIIDITEKLSDLIFSQVGFESKYLISEDQDFYSQFWKIKQDFSIDLDRLEILVDSTDEKEMFAKIKVNYENYLTLFNRQVDSSKKNKDLMLWTYRMEKDGLIDAINRNLREIGKKARSDRDQKITESNRISSHVLNVTSIIVVTAVVVGLIISFINTRSINRSILLLKEKTKEIADGKYTKISNIDSPPEIKDLADDFNMMCDRLKELDEMKEDFVRRVSHKLRTPLTAIREASGMLLEGSYAHAPEKQQELFRITKNECERLIDSVNEMLDLARMEAGMMNFQFKKLDLVPLIRQTVLKLAPLAQKKRIDLELKPLGELPKVMVDEERIVQVLENLLGNAIKYTDRNGKVVIHALRKNAGENRIEVSVADTGCGIPKESLETIFDKFKRLDDGTKNMVRGTGLGLSITKQIVSNHGGTIWVKSRPGEGSIFYFTLPV